MSSTIRGRKSSVRRARSAAMEVARTVIPTLAARWDAWRDRTDPTLLDGCGGPFNGQDKRLELVSQILEATSPDSIVETGTHRGTTTEYLAGIFSNPIHTVELEPRHFHYSKHRLRGHRNVKTHREDSRVFLRKGAGSEITKDRTLFYLDAHGNEDLPLATEIRLIAANWEEWIVLIDDFLVPDDPGYIFDTWSGRPFDLSLLPLGEISAEIFWPSAPSTIETGARRGCVVLSSKNSIAHELAKLPSLRQATDV